MKNAQAIVFLGDSVLWGYRLPADQNAVSLLAGARLRLSQSFIQERQPSQCVCARAADARRRRSASCGRHRGQPIRIQPSRHGVRNASSAIAALAATSPAPSDLGLLTLPPAPAPFVQRTNHALSSVSELYAMRADIRETLYGDVQPAPLPHLTVTCSKGRTILRRSGGRMSAFTSWRKRRSDAGRRIELVAFMTPTNHALMHEYIDNRHIGAMSSTSSGYSRRAAHTSWIWTTHFRPASSMTTLTSHPLGSAALRC